MSSPALTHAGEAAQEANIPSGPQPLLLEGKSVAAEMRRNFSEEVAALKANHSVVPGLAVVRVGQDPASVSYAGRIVQGFASVGLQATVFELPGTATRSMLQGELARLNYLPEFAAVMVQWPLPQHLGWDAVIDDLDPMKDVDGSHPENIGKLSLGLDCYVPATPSGGLALLDYYKIPIEGKRAVVVGRSGIVGRPMAHLLLVRNATVTVAHSRTRDLASVVREADIVAVATGKPGLITGTMLQPGAVVVDFGASMIDGQMRGDVDFQSALPVVGAITPVPGGTGPMTNAMLIRNTLKAIHRSLSQLSPQKRR